MDEATVGSLVIRVVTASLWTILMVRVALTRTAVTLLARRAICAVIVLVMWLLVLGAVATLGLFPTDLVRLATTIYAAFAAMIAIALLTTGEPTGGTA